MTGSDNANQEKKVFSSMQIVLPITNYRDLPVVSVYQPITQGPYLTFGTFEMGPCWLLYISVVKSQLQPALELLLPACLREGFSIAIPENANVHSAILNGSLGRREMGKVITIQLPLQQLNRGPQRLINLTTGFRGPVIPDALSLAAAFMLHLTSHHLLIIGRHFRKVGNRSGLSLSPIRGD